MEGTCQDSLVYFAGECGTDNTCIPDLQITSAQVNISGEQSDYFVLGSISDILVVASVRNVKENAYNARLIATFPSQLTIITSTPNQISCGYEREIKSQVVCGLGNPLKKKSVQLSIRMSVSGLTAATTNFTVELEAVSANPEENTTLADNSWTSSLIRTTSQVEFGIYSGKAVPDHIGFDPRNPSVDVNAPLKRESQIGRLVTHSFTVLNNGPSTVPQSELLIYWPLLLREDNNNNSYLLYIIDVQASQSVVCNISGLKDPLGLAIKAGDAYVGQAKASNKLRSRRPFNSSSHTEERCSDTTCIRCQLPPLAKGTSADITVASRLFERSLVWDNIVELNVTSLAIVSIPEIQNLRICNGITKMFSLTTRIDKPAEVTDKSVEPWVIVLAFSVTVVFLIGVIAVMCRLGFSKRSKKEQLDKKKEELEAHCEQGQNGISGETDSLWSVDFSGRTSPREKALLSSITLM